MKPTSAERVAMRRFVKAMRRARRAERCNPARWRRVWAAFDVGQRAERGDSCPFRKRKYVRAWLSGVADQRAARGRPSEPPTWRPRIQAESPTAFSSSLGRIRRMQKRSAFRRQIQGRFP